MTAPLKPRPFRTGDVARAVGTEPKMVRRAIARGLMKAIKLGGRWAFTEFQALVYAMIVILRSIGFTWAEIPNVLTAGLYHFPPGFPADTGQQVPETNGSHKLWSYLINVGSHVYVTIRGCGAPRTRTVEFWPEDAMPSVDTSHPITIIRLDPLYRIIRDRGHSGPGLTLEVSSNLDNLTPKKEKLVLARPALKSMARKQINSLPGIIAEGQYRDNQKTLQFPSQQSKPSRNSSQSGPNEIEESLNRAMQMMQDPGITTNANLLRQLAYLLDDTIDAVVERIHRC